METEITEAKLYEYAVNIERELKQYAQYESKAKAISDLIGYFLTDHILEIRREQTLINGRWETDRYIFLVTYGGPNAWIYTDGNIKVVWGGKSLEYIISDKEVLEFLKNVEYFLNQTLP